MIDEISYKTLIDSKPLQIRFDKIDGIIRIYDRTRYLTLFGTKKYDAINDKIRYLVSLKSNITYIYFHYFAKIKVDSFNCLPIKKKTLTLRDVMIFLKSVLNKDKNDYYYEIL